MVGCKTDYDRQTRRGTKTLPLLEPFHAVVPIGNNDQPKERTKKDVRVEGFYMSIAFPRVGGWQADRQMEITVRSEEYHTQQNARVCA